MLQRGDESHEGIFAGVITLINACAFEYLREGDTDFILDDLERFFRGRLRSETGHYLSLDPLVVLGQSLIGRDVLM